MHVSSNIHKDSIMHTYVRVHTCIKVWTYVCGYTFWLSQYFTNVHTLQQLNCKAREKVGSVTRVTPAHGGSVIPGTHYPSHTWCAASEQNHMYFHLGYNLRT